MSSSPTSGWFKDSGQSLGNANSYAVTLADIDGDSDLDALVANKDPTSPGAASTLWLNDGTGTFTDSGTTFGHVRDVQAADLDGDGDLDIVTSRMNTVWFNDGAGNFTASPMSGLGTAGEFAFNLGDVNGDGFIDAVTNEYFDSAVMLNDGAGNLSYRSPPGNPNGGWDMEMFDIDGDGDLDMVTGSFYFGRETWINDGTGRFTASGDPLTNLSREFASGDIDGDGDIDMIDEWSLWRNDGNGIFTPDNSNFGSSNANAVALADIDGDGDLDAVRAVDDHSEIWLNDGSGSFTDSRQNLGFGGDAIALGDLDGDGDLDLFSASRTNGPDGGENSVWINTALPPEPNDTLPEAFDTGLTSAAPDRLTLPGTIGDNAFGDLDVDYYSFTADAGATVAIDIDAGFGHSPPIDSYLRLFDSSGNELAMDKDTYAPGENNYDLITNDSFLLFEAPVLDTYVVGVSGVGNKAYDPFTAESGTAGSTGEYDISIEFIRSGFFDDPADVLANADPYPMEPYSQFHEIGDAPFLDLDVDLFLFNLEADEQFLVDVDARDIGLSTDTTLRLFDATGTQIAADIPAAGIDPLLTGDGLAAGTYYVGVSGSTNTGYDPTTAGSGVTGGSGPYQISIRTGSVTDLGETLADALATAVSPAATGPFVYSGSIGDSIATDFDVDMFSVELDAGDLLIADVDLYTSTTLRLFGPSGNELAFNDWDGEILGNGATVPLLEFLAPASGEYFVGISGDGNQDYDPLTVDNNVPRWQENGDYELSIYIASTTPTANADVLIGDSGPDSISALEGDDSVRGEGGNDSLLGNAGDDTLKGEGGNDTLRGGPGNDSLKGGDGNDLLEGSDGSDILNGGDGSDFILAGGDGDYVLGGFGDDAIFGGPGDDRLLGQSDNDLIDGAGGDDDLYGQDGNDMLLAGEGNDSLSGGRGNDTLSGAAGNDTLRGDDGDDFLIGADGSDSLDGGSGNDKLLGGSEGDILVDDLGNDTLYGATGDDSLSGGADDDILRGAEDNDTVEGGGGNDLVEGNLGADSLSGGDGADTLLGGPGDDILAGDAGADTLNGAGDDDLINGGADSDQLSGNDGADTLLGEEGDDFLLGGTGNDRLIGGSGNDTLFGAADADTFVIEGGTSQGNDSLLDLIRGSDTVEFSGFGTVLDAFDDLDTNLSTTLDNGDDHVTISGAHTIIDISGVTGSTVTGELTVVGVTGLEQADFLFS